MRRTRLSKLSLKIIITILIPIILMGGAFVALFIYTSTSWQYNDKVSYQSKLTDFLTCGLEDFFARQDYGQIRTKLSEIGKRLNIDRIRLLTKEGKILYDSTGDGSTNKVNPETQECLLCHNNNDHQLEIPRPVIQTYFSEGKEVIRHFTPILNRPSCQRCHAGSQKVLGFFLADFVQTRPDKRKALLLTQMGVSSVVTILVILTILYITLRRMIDYPVREIISQMRGISVISGNLRQIDFSSTDEIGEIVNLINELAERLRYSREELASWYQVTHEIASTLDFEKHILASMTVREAMDTDIEFIYADMPVKEVMEVFKNSQRIFFPVVDRNKTYLGVITLHEARNVLLDQSLNDIVYARDFYRADFPSISPLGTLKEAMDLFLEKGTAHLPVVDEATQALLGVVEHAHIFQILKAELVKRVGL
ncbi:MAG: CBS domain-containing protein [bacterium]